MLLGVPRRSPRDSPPGTTGTDQLILTTAGVLIAVVVALKATVLYAGWFYGDDYVLLANAAASDLDADYLLRPYVSRFMPGERLVFWFVAQAGTLNWAVAATFIVVAQLAVSISAAWMLFVLFGRRWGAVALLALFLTTAMTVPATLWFAAACDQMPLLIAFFLAVGGWVKYLRGEGRRWIAVTVGAVAFGLAFYVKTALIFPLLAYLAVAYFTTGPLRVRLRTALVRWWPAVLAGTLLAVGYAGYVSTRIEQPFVETDWSIAFELVGSMFGAAFATAALGGPWQWSEAVTPNVNADPPLLAQHASWALIALVVAYAALRRERTGRAWLLLVGYLAATWLLVATSRAPFIGAILGMQYRYLTDAACALVLCLGLVFLPLRGAAEGSRPRREPLLTRPVPTQVTVTGVVGICVMGLVSSALCAQVWRTTNASRPFMKTLVDEVEDRDSLDLVDRPLPDEVLSHLLAPDNRLSSVAPLLGDQVRFPLTSHELAVVTDQGEVRTALIDVASASRRGPAEGCGWFVDSRGTSIPLRSPVLAWDWWVRIGYLASAESTIEVTAGDQEVEAAVEPGPNSLYLQVPGSFRSIRIEGLPPGVSMCVDTVEVGVPAPGGALP